MLYFKNMEQRIETGHTLAEFTTFSVGGPVAYTFIAHTISEVCFAYEWARKKSLPVLVIGKGSNSLYSDGFHEALALICRIDHCLIEDDTVKVGSGYNFSLLGVQTARAGLSGLEFASGIPATVGGAIYMNAGANRQETKDALREVTYCFSSGEIRTFQKEELEFSYRKSSFQQMQGCILEATFILTKDATARSKQLQILDYRIKTQPYKDKSAGCAFKNPGNGLSAGALIERCGLKGFSMGGAKVSELHANFIVNTQNATAADIDHLMKEVRARVLKETGIDLQPEIRCFNHEI